MLRALGGQIGPGGPVEEEPEHDAGKGGGIAQHGDDQRPHTQPAAPVKTVDKGIECGGGRRCLNIDADGQGTCG